MGRFNVTQYALSRGFVEAEAVQFQQSIQVLVAPIVGFDSALQITNAVQYKAIMAGITNMDDLLQCSKMVHVTALKFGYDITTALTFTNEYQVMGCKLSSDDPLCYNVNSIVQIKALKCGVPIAAAAQVNNMAQIAVLMQGSMSTEDALKFSNAWQIKNFLKSNDVVEALKHPTASDRLLRSNTDKGIADFNDIQQLQDMEGDSLSDVINEIFLENSIPPITAADLVPPGT